MKTASYIWFLMMVFAMQAYAQGAFKTVVNRNTIAENEALQVTFVVENMDDRNFTPPDFKGFNVLNGPMKGSTSMNINGAKSFSITYVYLLQPQGTGKLTIGPASIESGGQTVKSNSVTITVNKAGAQSNTGSNSRNGGGNNSGKMSVNDYLKENLFFRLTIDKNEVYKGEQIMATYKLYSRVKVNSNYDVVSPAVYNGFWPVEFNNQLDWKVETLNGVQYNVAVAKQVALFPQRTGDMEVDAMGLECTVLIPTGGFFGYQDYRYKFSSNTAKVKVKPLPEAGKPADFLGLVGELDMQVTLDKTEARTDDPITLSIKFSGKGNLKLLENPKIELPKDFEVFDPKITEKSTKQGNTVGGTRQIDYLLIPRRAGMYKLPALSASYFDLKKNQYVTLRSPEMVLAVEGESTIKSPITSGINKEEIELLGQDIRYIETANSELRAQGGFFLSIPAYATLYAVPFVLFGGLLVFKRKRDQMLGNTKLMKHRKAGKVAAKRLKLAEARMKENDKRGFYDELLKATWGYLGDKLGIPPSDLNREVAANALRAKGIAEAQIQELANLLDGAEMALYAPSSISESLQQTYDRATAVIDHLENGLI